MLIHLPTKFEGHIHCDSRDIIFQCLQSKISHARLRWCCTKQVKQILDMFDSDILDTAARKTTRRTHAIAKCCLFYANADIISFYYSITLRQIYHSPVNYLVMNIVTYFFGNTLHDLRDWILNPGHFQYTKLLQLIKNKIRRIYHFLFL